MPKRRIMQTMKRIISSREMGRFTEPDRYSFSIDSTCCLTHTVSVPRKADQGVANHPPHSFKVVGWSDFLLTFD
jgi:hypothetical protein